jgi:hypothetical protein
MKKLIGGLVVVSVLFLGCEKKSEEAPVETPVKAVETNTTAKVVEANTTTPAVEANASAPVEANTTAPAAN